jgi:hypothetical protein
MVGTTRSRMSFFMNRFRKLGFIDYSGGLEGGLQVHSSLLNLFARLSFACPVMLCLCGLRGLKGAISGRNVMPTRLARKWF